jgi:hypothetical protein
MLKIKDGIDLKELEKFWFRVNSDGDYKCDLGDNRSDLVVYTENCPEEEIVKGQIALRTGYYGDYPETWFCEQLDVLYDLIKADMVEKECAE